MHTGKLLLRTTICSLVAFIVCSCGGALRGLVRGKAAEELGCPKERIHVHGVATYTYRAIGCSRWADYRCVRTSNGSTYCSRLDEPVSPFPTPQDFAHAEQMGSTNDQ
jgi:hypothetical protein